MLLIVAWIFVFNATWINYLCFIVKLIQCECNSLGFTCWRSSVDDNLLKNAMKILWHILPFNKAAVRHSISLPARVSLHMRKTSVELLCWFVYSFTLHRRKPTITSNFMVAWHLYRLWFVCLSHLKTLHSLNLNLFSQLNLLVCSVRERGKWCLLEGTWRCILQETETRQECAQLP